MAAPSRLRFFPKFDPLPVHGNGKAAASQEAKALVVAPGVTFVPIDASGRTMNLATPTGGWYRGAWLAYACMRYRAEKLIEPPLWIAEEKDGEEQWLKGDHPLAEVLERPNPDMEMSDLLELTSLYLDSTGGCVWVKNRDRMGRVASLYAFSKDEYTTRSGDAEVTVRGRKVVERRVYAEFHVATAGAAVGGRRKFGPDDVVHFRRVDPADPHAAVAPLQAASRRLGINLTLEDCVSAGLRNAVVPGMVLGFPENQTLSKEQRDEVKADLATQYESARNHGKSLVIGGGVTANRLKLGFAGLEGGELSLENEAAVCACFQTPPVVIGAYVGLANSSDRHNLETSVLLVYDNAIVPTWTRIEKVLTRGLLREVDPNPLRFIRFDRSKVKALQADRAAAADVVQKAGRALRVDDARALLGLQLLGGEEGAARLVGGSAPTPTPPEPVDPGASA